MSGYAIKNLKDEVEDAARKFGMPPEMEARFAREQLGAERIGVSFQGLAPNARGAFGHHHRSDEEIYVVVAGGGRVKLDDDVREVRQWDAIRVAPGTTRQFESGPDGLELIAFGTHAPGEEQDAQVIPNWWSEGS
jgi:mannose-6-phosphate isomerase-like protein (cupin superfamily)